MNRMRSFVRRGSAALLLLLLFWTASQLASRVPWIVALGTSVHALGLGDYSADPFTSLAPLSMQILDEARADAGTPSALSTPAPTPISALRPPPAPYTPPHAHPITNPHAHPNADADADAHANAGANAHAHAHAHSYTRTWS